MAHTPGPWHVGRLDGGDMDERVIEVYDGGPVIGTVWQMGADFDGEVDNSPERDANANVIAAGPELLDACIQALDHVFGGPSECNCGGPCEGTCTQAILISAVAKALGQTTDELKKERGWGGEQ